MKKWTFLCLTISIEICVFALRVPAAQAETEAAFVENLTVQAISIFQRKDMAYSEREEKFSRIFRRGFDTFLIARFALGRHWRVATKKQRRDYLELFPEYVAKSYSAKLRDYNRETLVIVSEKRLQNSKDVLVNMKINRPGRNSIATVWRVRRSDGQLKIVDVIIEGISMLASYRQEISAVIRRNGLEGLLDILRAKTEKQP